MSESEGEQLPAYRDFEEFESGSSSAISLLIQDEPDHSGEVLPGYDDSVDEPAQSAGGQNGRVGGARRVGGVGGGETEGEANIDAPPEFEVYLPKVKRIRKIGKISNNIQVLTGSHDKHINTDGEALHRWLLEQRSKPPCVQVHIRGTHTKKKRTGNHTYKSVVTDFDITCDITHLLLEQNDMGEPTLATIPPDKKAHRGHGRLRSVAKDLEVGVSVRDFADQYCEDQSTFKEFVMKKVVVGHDRAYLERRIAQCIRSTNYLGRISVGFPIHDTRVEAYPANRISKLRKTGWFRLIFYITFLWVFTWPYLWFMTRRYHVATMTWRMSRPMQDESGETRRECVLTEEEWIRRCGPAIRRAARARKVGSLSAEDVAAAWVGLSGDAGVRVPAPCYSGLSRGCHNYTEWKALRSPGNQALGWGGNTRR